LFAVPIAHLVGPGRIKATNGRLAFQELQKPALALDVSRLTMLYCYGDVSISGKAMQLLLHNGVQTAWMTAAGNRCHGRLFRADPSTTLARIRQHRVFADPEARRAWAARLVAGKMDAMSAAARHYQRHGAAAAGQLLAQLAALAGGLNTAASADQVRGLEGAATAAWFAFFAQVLSPPWIFPGRRRQPPTDPVNALLSLGYTFLLTRADARAAASGFETYIGALHEYRPGRPSLACDLIEPLRVPAVDRWVAALLARRELAPADFMRQENGGFLLRPGLFGPILSSWESHWETSRQDQSLQEWIDALAVFLRERDLPDPPGSSDVDL